MAAASPTAERTETPAKTGGVVRCGGHSRSGKPCGHPAGYGTDHTGYGNCKHHGGASPSGKKHAARIVADQIAGEYDIPPDEALLWLVQRAAYRVAWLSWKVEQLEPDALIVNHLMEKVKTGVDGPSTETVTSSSVELHIWVQAMIQAEDQLGRYAKMALDAGVDERRVRALEHLAGGLTDAFRAVFRLLDLTPEQLKRAPVAVEAGLRLLEGGQAA